MAFCIRKKEAIAKAIPRLACERIENAIDCLEDCSRAEAVHCARKDLKKSRAVLRLARSEISRKDNRRVTGLIRKAAASLAGPRDAYVKVKTLRDLAQHFKGQLSQDALRNIRQMLRRASDSEIRQFMQNGKRKSVRKLRRVGKAFARLKIKSNGWKAIGPGLKTSYGNGRRAYAAACKSGAPEDFHQWRKRAKDLWYDVTLLSPIWPEQMEATAQELKTLGEYLGDDHDLFVLRESIRENVAEKVGGQEWALLQGLIDERQRELRRVALRLGMRLYAEKTAAFCQRLEKYWRSWRREKKQFGSLVGGR